LALLMVLSSILIALAGLLGWYAYTWFDPQMSACAHSIAACHVPKPPRLGELFAVDAA